MVVRGIRGATVISENTKEAIVKGTSELLDEIIRANDIKLEDIASVLFTATPDLNAAFPALAARRPGWEFVPRTCAQEMSVSGDLSRVVRVLILVNTEKTQKEIKHIYLNEAKSLRPDLENG